MSFLHRALSASLKALFLPLLLLSDHWHLEIDASFPSSSFLSFHFPTSISLGEGKGGRRRAAAGGGGRRSYITTSRGILLLVGIIAVAAACGHGMHASVAKEEEEGEGF